MSSISPFPLATCSENDLQSLCQCLFDWRICDSCKVGWLSAQHEPSCTWNGGRERLNKFISYYQATTRAYSPELLFGHPPAVNSHEQLHELISALKTDLNISRDDFVKNHFGGPKFCSGSRPSLFDQNKGVDLAVRVMLMLNCASNDLSLGLLESGVAPLPWRRDETLLQFFSKTFPQAAYQLLDAKAEYERTPGITALLAASKLTSMARLELEPTDDIRDHLRLDQNTGVVLIYHHIGFLIECLTASYDAQPPGSLQEEIKAGNLPRQLALEVLDSLQKVLFPPDETSRRLLSTMISKSSFDPECLKLHSDSYRRPDEQQIKYRYLSSRLMELYEAILNPRPRGLLEKWAERRSGARYVMIATLIGVIIAVILGLLGLIVSVFQAWVSYQAWKYPVAPAAP